MTHDKLTYFEVASGKIDRRRGVIKGCAVITVGEAKGHGMRVDLTTLEQVKDCAEEYIGGLAVRFAQEDHGGGAANIIGNLRNWRIEDDTLRADLYLLKAHQDYELVMEMAATMPESFGLSIVFSGVHEDTDDGTFARCAELYGCDVVKNPAANPTGLFAAKPTVDTNTEGERMKTEKDKQIEVELSQTTAALKTAEDSLKLKDESITKLTTDATALTAKCGELETALKAKTDEAAKSVESLQAVAVEVEQLKAKLVEAEASAGKKAQEALAAIGVPPVNTDVATAEPSAEQLKAEYEKLAKTNFAKARDFWKKHEAKLSTPQMMQWKKQNGLY
jgi:hypothetical protein